MRRDDQFGGVIGRYHDQSSPWWPEPDRAPSGSPNVVIVVLDDVGFAQLGCFGSNIATPTFDGLAADGLRYTSFHTTALCSPTRSCVLTGRNHHSNGMGRVIEIASGYPGYNARIPFANGFLSEILVDQGYATYAIGKWHLTPEDELHAGASRVAVASRTGIRAFLRVHVGRNPSVRAKPDSRQPLCPSPLHPRGGIPPDPRLGGSSNRLCPRSARQRSRQALLLVLRHGRLPLASPITAGVDQALRGCVRRGVGRLAGCDLGPSDRFGGPPSGNGTLAPPRLGPSLGHLVNRRAPTLCPLHGSLRRVLEPHRSRALETHRLSPPNR